MNKQLKYKITKEDKVQSQAISKMENNLFLQFSISQIFPSFMKINKT